MIIVDLVSLHGTDIILPRAPNIFQITDLCFASCLTSDDYVIDTNKHNGNVTNGTLNAAPEYIPPPPPPPLSEEVLMFNDSYRQNEDSKFAGKSPIFRARANAQTFESTIKVSHSPSPFPKD